MKKNADKRCSPMNQGQIQEFLFGGLSCNTSVRLGSASVFFSSRFLLFFFFFLPVFVDLGDNLYCYEQCIHCSHTVHTLFTY